MFRLLSPPPRTRTAALIEAVLLVEQRPPAPSGQRSNASGRLRSSCSGWGGGKGERVVEKLLFADARGSQEHYLLKLQLTFLHITEARESLSIPVIGQMSRLDGWRDESRRAEYCDTLTSIVAD